MRSIARYLLILAFQMTISGVFIVLFRSTFAYRRMILPLHMLLVTAMTASVICISVFLLWILHKKHDCFARYIVAFVHACATMALLCLYVMDYVANNTWGANVSAKAILDYVIEFRSLFNFLPTSPVWICGSAAVFIVAVFATYFALARTIQAGLSDIFLPAGRLGLFATWKRSCVFGLLALALATAFVLFIERSTQWRGQFWHGEPIMALFVGSPHPMFAETERSFAVAQEAQRIRAEYPPAPDFEQKNIFVIMSDSLRASQMQVYGYERQTTPFMAGLASEGRLRKVELATSTCPETACGVLSSLASRNYAELSYYNLKIYDLLHDLGYRTYFIGGGDHTNFNGTRDALGHHIDLFFDGNSTKRYSLNDDRAILEGLEQVPECNAGPAFFFIFLVSTHQIGVRHDEYAHFKPDRIAGSDPWLSRQDPQAIAALVNRYDNGVVQADDIIRQIFDALQNKGYLSNAIGAILSDHGEALGEKGFFLHCSHLYQEFIGIPILFYDDPAVSYRGLEYGTQVDVAPTLLDRLGLPIPSCWEGVSLLAPARPRYTLHTTTGTMPHRAVIYRTPPHVYKYIRSDSMEKDADREELFELTSDPHEQHNLIETADRVLVDELRKKVADKYDNWHD